jgi:hypothetical protein
MARGSGYVTGGYRFAVQSAFLEPQRGICQALSKPEIVTCQADCRGARAQLSQRLHEPPPPPVVEARERLVEEQNLWFVDDRAADGETLP